MTQRYFIKLAYNGSSYSGWQSQPNAPSVQSEVEKCLSTLYNIPVAIVGCGRTDAGVHASMYYAHADLVADKFSNQDLAYKMNTILPLNISVLGVLNIQETKHARFDAEERSYIYKMTFVKDPFNQKLKYKFDQADTVDFKKLQESVLFLEGKHDFYTFCKTHTDVKNYICTVNRSLWIKEDDTTWYYHISANRFLRGMVRLIVGMSLNVAMDRISLLEAKGHFSNKERMVKAWSVPAHGLYLSNISYPFIY